MRLGRASILAAVPVILLLAALPATADAAHLQSVRFRATLSGAEAVTWSLNYTTVCGTETGRGSQSIAFHQAGKSLVLVFTRQLGGTRLLAIKRAGRNDNELPIRGRMTQAGTLASTPSGKCPPGRTEGPPVAAPQPDCGTKSFTGTIRASWSTPDYYPGLPDEPAPLLPQFWLDEPLTQTRFAVCPFFGPLILFRLTHAGLSEDRVFGSKPKLTVHDEAKKVNRYPEAPQGVLSESAVSFTLHLTRLTGGPRR